jgi:hypothetical protein
MSEYTEQCALFRWVALMEPTCPDLALFFHVPNESGNADREQGQLRGARRKAAGVRAGVPDNLLPVARQGYAGLALELKTATGTLRPAQRAWHTRLTAAGWRVVVCRSWGAAARELCAYLGLPGPEGTL